MIFALVCTAKLFSSLQCRHTHKPHTAFSCLCFQGLAALVDTATRSGKSTAATAVSASPAAAAALKMLPLLDPLNTCCALLGDKATWEHVAQLAQPFREVSKWP